MALAGSLIRTHCLSPARARSSVDTTIGSGRYARMFPDLPAFEADDAFPHAIGGAGGLCDCGDEEDTPESLGTVAAGWPVFGQFVAHDITADRSALGSHVDIRALRNARAPQLNLECLYGDGPVGHPSCTSAVTQRNSSSVRVAPTSREMLRASGSLATRETTRTC